MSIDLHSGRKARREKRKKKKRATDFIAPRKRNGGLLVTRTAATYQIAPAFAFSETLVEVRGLVSGHVPRALLVVLFLELRRENHEFWGNEFWGEECERNEGNILARAPRKKTRRSFLLRASDEDLLRSFGSGGVFQT